LSFSLPSSQEDARYFTINENGDLKNLRVLANVLEKATPFYQFQVQVSDNARKNGEAGSAAKSSTANLKVCVGRFCYFIKDLKHLVL